MYVRYFPASAPAVITLAIGLGAPVAHAEEAQASQQTRPGAASSGPIEEIRVISHPLSAEGLALSSEVLDGEELERRLQSTIGETVGRLPGVHAADFGQAASRPVIHGLSGPRVRIMEDRIDSMDVSVTSADHAVTIEPFIADRIEILKGPSALIYGTGAIGGVVDVHTGRIPHESTGEPISGRFEARGADNADRVTAAGRLNGDAGPFTWHLDGSYRDADDYDIPGFAESDELRALEDAEHEEEDHDDEDHDEHEDEEEVRGTLPGSELENQTLAAGLSWTGERGFAGIAVSTLEADYGLPGGHEHAHEEDHDEDEEDHDEEHDEEHEHVEGTPTVDLEQTRIDLEAGLSEPLPGFESLNLRVGINDYEHQEIEPDGAVATTFDNQAWEARVELTHQPVAGWRGALGVQFSDRDFEAEGEEAFIAPVETQAMGAFWVGERSFGGFDLEAGLRIGDVDVDSSTASSESFTTYAVSLGLVVPFGDAWSLGLLVDRSARAPIAEELYSYGPHLATGAFEIGNPDLDVEEATSLSANLRYSGEILYFNSSVYYTAFDDFIYEAATGTEEDDLPVFVYTQNDADFVGLDAEVRITAAQWDAGSVAVRATFDTVEGQLDVSGNDNLPRIPPTRYGIGADLNWGPVRASLDHTWVRDQNDVADFELPTDGYRDLRAFVGADLPLGGQTLTLFLQGRNLTDQEQRQHSSFIKDTAPLPGRTIEAGLRARF